MRFFLFTGPDSLPRLALAVCLALGPLVFPITEANAETFLMAPLSQLAQASTNPVDPAASDVDTLLDALALAQDGPSADALAAQIQRGWNQSGSAAVDLLMQRATLAMSSRNLALALDLLDTVVVLSPDFAEGWNRRATVHFMRDDFAHSIADVEQVLRLEPRHFGALSGLGRMLETMGQDRQAALFLGEALRVHPFLGGTRERLEAIERRLQGAPI